MDFFETIGIAALNRANEDDRQLNLLVERIVREIGFPLLPPVATLLSQGYFHIYPWFNLLCLPLVEPAFLLHLPDLYHELGHLLSSNATIRAPSLFTRPWIRRQAPLRIPSPMI